MIDFSLLFLLHGKAKINIAIATSLAYWTSIVYNFTLNRYWTFNAWEKESLKRHIVTYLALLVFNYTFAVTFITLASHHVNYLLAKILAVAIQMLWTYPIYKKMVFVTQSKVS